MAGASVAGACFNTRRYETVRDGTVITAIRWALFGNVSLFVLRIPATTTLCDCSSFCFVNPSLVILPGLANIVIEVQDWLYCLCLYHEWLSCCSLSLSFGLSDRLG